MVRVPVNSSNTGDKTRERQENQRHSSKLTCWFGTALPFSNSCTVCCFSLIACPRGRSAPLCRRHATAHFILSGAFSPSRAQPARDGAEGVRRVSGPHKLWGRVARPTWVIFLAMRACMIFLDRSSDTFSMRPASSASSSFLFLSEVERSTAAEIRRRI